jgi:hypothetical protein
MAERSENHMAAVGYFNTQHFRLINGTWLNWKSSGALRWKGEIAGWEGRGVVCEKPTPLRL